MNAGTSISESTLSRILCMRLPCDLPCLCEAGTTVATLALWTLGPGFLITLTWLMQLRLILPLSTGTSTKKYQQSAIFLSSTSSFQGCE